MKGLLIAFCCCLTALLHGQSFYRTSSVVIHGNGQTTRDTIKVSGLNATSINGNYGLDSITLNINYSNDQDLLISLIAPDGTVLQLADNLGGGSANFTKTKFTMSVNNIIDMGSAPFTGAMRPDSWMGRVNNGQSGIGNWILQIINTTSSNNSGNLLGWGLHFNNTPAPPEFFHQSSLPIIVINTNNVVPQANTKNTVTGTMGIINNTSQSNSVSDSFNEYNGDITINIRGSSSASFPQQSFTVSTVLASGANNNVSIFGMGKGNDWVLYGAWDDKSLVRDALTYQISNEMGAYAPRTKFCEVIINGDYKGVYSFMEKIKQGSGRVNISKLDAATVSGSALTGGYIFEVDRPDGSGSWNSQYPPCTGSSDQVSFVYEYPTSGNINSAQKTYIAAYVDSFESALKNKSLYDTVNGYRHFINVSTFIDQSILQELGHNVDGYRLSSFLNKDVNGKLQGGPIWDFNLAFGNADYYNGSATNIFEWDLPCPYNDPNLNPFWWQEFLTDTAYVDEYKCRYSTLTQTTLDTNHIDHIIDSFTNVLQVPQARDFTRWPVLGVYLWPNAYVGNTWQDEMNYLKTWIHQRIEWMDSELYDSTCIATNTPPTGIHTINDTTAVNIYPNPATSVLNIECRNATLNRIQIFNMTGQMIWDEIENNKNATLNLRDRAIAPGIYSITITTNQGTVRDKLIIE